MREILQQTGHDLTPAHSAQLSHSMVEACPTIARGGQMKRYAMGEVITTSAANDLLELRAIASDETLTAEERAEARHELKAMDRIRKEGV